MKTALEKQWSALGLGAKELQLYRSVLKLGVARAAEIGHQADIPRQTVYMILTKLIAIGLVDQRDKRGVKHFSSEPRRLLEIMKQQEDVLRESRREVEKEIQEFETLRFRSSALPKIQYYEGVTGLRRLLDDILAKHKRGADKEFRGWGVNLMGPALGEHLFSFIKKRGALGIETRLFIGQGPDDLGLEKGALGRTVKRLSYTAQDAALYLVGDALYLFSYRDQVGVLIENRDMAKLLKAVFDQQWMQTKA